ncbi:glycosyltransferase family 4 protein [uncultured Brevundimonas sp.]|uniref:glycosyltransferase family 4 protein n=1 Tax=uncultured Brevundimonas sp. TaxID=213418 RepID=UPI0025FF46D5|nr:glycosyltransferase family 4 protein [uncultured Brevundimonas sp.]
MRIAVVLPRGCTFCPDKTNSMETVVRTLSAHSRLNRLVTLIADAGGPTPSGVQMVTVPAGLGRKARNAAVVDVLKKLSPDIVEYHQQLKAASELARQLPNAIHVLYRHTRIKPSRNLIERLRYGRRLARFDRLVFVSRAAGEEFATDYPRLAGRVSSVCNPIESDAWRASPEQREKLILFSGRAMKDKGLDLFCTALAETLDRHPDWRGALMLGDWAKHQDWAAPQVRLLERFGDRVEIHKSASLDAVRAITQRAAIAVTPSRVREALGLAALEAHAAGAALISSGRGGLREASGEYALYVDVEEVGSLTSAMMRLVENPDERLALARGGQAYVERVHSPAARAAELDALREALIDKAFVTPKPTLRRLPLFGSAASLTRLQG